MKVNWEEGNGSHVTWRHDQAESRMLIYLFVWLLARGGVVAVIRDTCSSRVKPPTHKKNRWSQQEKTIQNIGNPCFSRVRLYEEANLELTSSLSENHSWSEKQ